MSFRGGNGAEENESTILDEPMTIKQFKERIGMICDERYDDRHVGIRLALPSVGPLAISKITRAWVGYDWDRDLILETSQKLVPKTDKQDVFEAAFDLLAYIATKEVKKDSYEIRTAKMILARYGYGEEKLKMIARVFHGR